jgi:hypothetical protein
LLVNQKSFLAFDPFVIFKDFNAGQLKTFADKDLQNGFDLLVKVEQFRVNPVLNLSRFVFALWNWNVNGRWFHVDEVVRLDFELVDHVFEVFELFPMAWFGHPLGHVRLSHVVRRLVFRRAHVAHFLTAWRRTYVAHLLGVGRVRLWMTLQIRK